MRHASIAATILIAKKLGELSATYMPL